MPDDGNFVHLRGNNALLACFFIVLTVSGISLVPELPSMWWSLAPLAFCLLLHVVGMRRVESVARMLWGYATVVGLALLWAVYWGHQGTNNRLSEELEGRPLLVTGIVSSLPVATEFGVRFVLKVEALSQVPASDGLAVAPEAHFPEYIRLNWYRDETVTAGSSMSLNVVLKRPHGTVNLGGFDYERWLFSRRIGATGYVRSGSDQGLLPTKGFDFERIHAVRQDIRQKVLGDSPYSVERALAVALMIGDKSALAIDDKQRLQRMGLAHLLAISGLHIGLAAGLGLLIGQLLGRCLNAVLPGRIFAPEVALVCSWCVAAGYSLMAGLSLPTQRAMIMLTVWILVSYSGRQFSPWLAWWLALAAVFLVFPLSIYEVGMWLSFGAVAVLVATFRGRWAVNRPRWWDLILAQGVLFVAMGVLQWFVGLPLTAVSPLVNLVAIPYISVLVVPLLLLLIPISLVAASVPESLIAYALMPLQAFSWILASVDAWLMSVRGWDLLLLERYGRVTLLVQVLTLSVLVLMFLPLPKGLKLIACLSCVAVVFPRQNESLGVEVVILDVGQGLSVVVHTRDGHYLIDTGKAFHAERVIKPYLAYRGVYSLQTVVVSHGDADHAGGLPTLMAGGGLPVVEELWMGAEDRRRWLPEIDLSRIEYSACSGQRTNVWGEIKVSSYGVHGGYVDSPNNRSCVVLLEYAGVRILLPGDIEAEREKRLLDKSDFSRPVDIVVAPHHGSRTSSSVQWVSQLRPRWVVYSAGYRNRYGHPAHEVVKRYEKVVDQSLDTAEYGALHFNIYPDGEVALNSARNLRKRYWM